MMNSIALVLGISQLFLWADFAFIWDATFGRMFGRKELKFQVPKLPWEIWLIAGVVLVTSVWSPDGVTGVQTGVRIFVVALWLSKLKRRASFRVMQCVAYLAVVIAILAAVEFLQGGGRVSLIYNNPYIFGLLGLVLLPVPATAYFGAIIAALSGTRTIILVHIFWAVINARRYKFVRFIPESGLLLFMLMSLVFPARLGGDQVFADAGKRAELTKSRDYVLDEHSDGRCGALRAVEFKALGYGFRGFCLSTGQARPHNVFQLSIYELGLFTPVFWFGIIGLARRVSWRVWSPLILLGFFSDDLFSRPEGVYLIAVWLLANGVFSKKVNVSNVGVCKT